MIKASKKGGGLATPELANVPYSLGTHLDLLVLKRVQLQLHFSNCTLQTSRGHPVDRLLEVSWLEN